MAYNTQRAEQRAKFARGVFSPRKVTECGETACIRCHPAENSGRAGRRRDARKVRRNVGTTRSRCIFIQDGADAADESGYVGSLLPSFVSLPYLRRSLTAAATPSLDLLPFAHPRLSLLLRSFLPSCSRSPVATVIFSASSSFATSSQFYFGTIRGIFRHTGARPNAVIHHPRCNTPYNVLCRRMANPSRSNVIAKPTAILFPAALSALRGTAFRGLWVFCLRESPVEI